MRSKFMKLLVPCFLLLIASCGGGGGGGSDDENVGEIVTNAFFIDAAVSGLEYRSSSHSGVTGESGEFPFTAGETTSFSFKGLELGSVAMTASTSIVTPLEVLATTDKSDQRVINLLVLLQSLDNDQNPDNGISLPPVFSGIDLSGLDISDADFLVAAAAALGNLTLVSEADAIAHFDLTLAGLNATPNTIGNWVYRNPLDGDVNAYYQFLADGTVTIEEYDDCKNNDVYWAATRQSAKTNCTTSELELGWTLTDKKLVMSNEKIKDSCTIVSSGLHEISASCVFQGVGSNEIVLFQREADAFDNLVAEKYVEVGVGSLSYTQYTFGADGASGGYVYVMDGVPQSGNGDVGEFASWSASGTSLDFEGIDNTTTPFLQTNSLVKSINGAWDVSGIVEGSTIAESFVLIPDFNANNAGSVIDGVPYAVYDAVSGVCQGVYMFGINDPVMRKDASSSSSSLICDFAGGIVLPQSTDPDVFTVSTEFGAITLEKGSSREICWPVQLVNITNGDYSVMACSDNTASDHSFQIWRAL